MKPILPPLAAVLVLALAATPAHAQVTQGTTAWNSNSTSLQITTATPNELLVIAMSGWPDLSSNPTMTVNGSAATRLTNTLSTGNSGRAAAFYFQAGAAGAYTCQVTSSTSLPYVFLFAVSLRGARASTIQAAVSFSAGSTSATTSLTTDNVAEYVLCIANHNSGSGGASNITFTSPQATLTEYAEFHRGSGIDSGWAWFNSGNPGVYQVTASNSLASAGGSIILMVAVENDQITPPEPPQNVAQSDYRGPLPHGGWTSNQVTFSADLDDIDPLNRVQLQVQVKTPAQSWNDAAPPTVTSPFEWPGPVAAVWDVPATGSYDWRSRVVDSTGLTYPTNGSWIEFDPASPDFLSDQTAPPVPSPLMPGVNEDVPLLGVHFGPVGFSWTASPDDLSGGVTYDVEVSDAAGGGNPLAGAVAISFTGVSLSLNTGHDTKYWHVRASDQAGNVSAWSPWIPFRVVYRDLINHAAGDGKKNCGFSAAAGSSAAGALAWMALATGLLRRRVRSTGRNR